MGRLCLTAVITAQLMRGEPGTGFSHTGSTPCSLCQHFMCPRKYREQAGGHGLRWEGWLGAGSGTGGVRLGEGI